MSKKLNKRQQIAVEMLASGCRATQVANTLSISKETVTRWQNKEDFEDAVTKSHLRLLKEINDETLNMAGQAHEAIKDAFNDFNITKVAKASLAIRFMSMLGSQNNPYAKFRNDYNTHHSIREEAQESFKEVLRVLDLLAALKTTNGHLSDAEYRKKAEDIVRYDNVSETP